MEKIIPEFLEKMLLKQYSQEIVNDIKIGYISDRKVTCRVNTLKADIAEIENELINKCIEYEKDEFNKDAIIFKSAKEADLKSLKIYEDGKIYLQSLSSMLPPIVLDAREKENILDMCAAPGGKTSQVAAMCNNKVMITACEKNKIRAERLRYNLNKLGVGCVNVMLTDSRYLSDYFSFDKILLDAPCSGSGTDGVFGKEFSEELINRSMKFQEELLRKALKLVKPGNEILYSTCSVLKCENEGILEKFKNQIEIVPINIFKNNNIKLLPTTIEGTICVCPTIKYEGFFIAKLKKKDCIKKL